MTSPALLALANDSLFYGESIGVDGKSSGELVFNTAMTGYQEILTDPSYMRQIVSLTYPHIGNTGVNLEDEESSAVYATGLVIREVPYRCSSWRQQDNLPAYLKRRGIVAIAGIDTRRLTRILREQGAQNAVIWAGVKACENEALAQAKALPSMAGMDLAQAVTTNKPYLWSEADCREKSAIAQRSPGSAGSFEQRYQVVAYDFGIKRSILRRLEQSGCEINVIPATTPASEVLAMDPDGVFLSNGPGDPKPCHYAISAIKAILPSQMPIFGICLGHQLLSLALGARTLKLKFGHHGANHPVQDIRSKKVMITSQNHGFTVDENALPTGLRITHRSLFDGSVQGVESIDYPVFGFQGHPEASPGPHDLYPLFDRFVDMMQAYRRA